MRQHLAELLASVVSTTYGSYYGAVLSALTTRSRATSAQLIRALPNLSSNDVRLALVALVQQHIVNHHTDQNGVTSYEPNWEYAYTFMCRLPTLYKFIDERYDADVANVFNAVARSGIVSIGDLLADLCPAQPNGTDDNHNRHMAKTNENGAAGIEHSRARSALSEKDTYGALNLLFAAGYLIEVNSRQFWPLHDRESEATEQTLRDYFPDGATVKKEKEDLKNRTTALLRDWRNEDESFTPVANGTAKSGRKRAADNEDSDLEVESESRAPKRRQLNRQLPAQARNYRSWLSAHQDPLDHGLVVAVNFDKCAVGLRTNHFIQYCEQHVHPTTAKVYGALVRALEKSTSRCFDPLQKRPADEREFFGSVYQKPIKIDIGLSEAVTTKEVANMLDPELDLTEGLAPEPDDDIEPSIENANGVNGHTSRYADDEDDYDDDPASTRLRRIAQHLRILVCDSRGLVRTKTGEWMIPFHSTTQRIIEAELESSITHTLGTLPARIIRILKYYGHQELRHLASRAMVTEDQARTACQLLQQAGWIDVAELPRTTRREVTKSLWLWAYDVLEARQKCLADCYFTMTRLSMRLQSEREEIESVITKSERSDVIGNEDKFLNNEEKVALAKFAKSTDLVTRQLVRMDELVAVMRDFSAMEYPHKLWDLGWIDWQSPERDGSEEEKRAIEEEEREGEGRDDEFHDEDEDEGFMEPE